MFDSLLARGLIERDADDLALTPSGRIFAGDFGIDLPALDAGKSRLCRECLDWSERRSHLAGSLGRAILGRIEDLGWARRDRQTRIVSFTPDGETRFLERFCRGQA